MMEKLRVWSPLAALGLVVVLTAVACNNATDDPGVSENVVTVSSVNPLTACVDVDGELVDLDGDGTKETTVYSSVTQTINFDSRLRGQAGGAWNDVIFSSVDINYILDGSAPPDRSESVTITVPAGGTASQELTTVLATDIAAGFFSLGERGRIDLVFRGEDASGEPMTARGQVPVETATSCGTQ
ncbi:MAG: hypothetical protein Q9Q40_12995 [Acidobacteriota bacterium]|nr:hypothetical protein [Acidobacteriota bacterium]MDQ7087195.1 hypothetical protein [Acidobacteriota bacterium]